MQHGSEGMFRFSTLHFRTISHTHTNLVYFFLYFEKFGETLALFEIYLTINFKPQIKLLKRNHEIHFKPLCRSSNTFGIWTENQYWDESSRCIDGPICNLIMFLFMFWLNFNECLSLKANRPFIHTPNHISDLISHISWLFIFLSIELNEPVVCGEIPLESFYWLVLDILYSCWKLHNFYTSIKYIINM